MGKVKKKPGRPEKKKVAKDIRAKPGSDQAKLNRSHRGAKLNQWDPKMMQWAVEYRQKEMKTKSEDNWKPLSWYAEETGISKTTLWKRFKGIVEGTGHQSGGKNKSKILPPEAEEALAERAGE